MGNGFQLSPTTGARESVEVLARKLELESRLTLADFPFDPSIRTRPTEHGGRGPLLSEFSGLDKLRAIPDGDPQKRQLWALHWLAEAREENGDAERDRRGRAAKAAREERERLLGLSKVCLAGKRGKIAREVALHILRDPAGAMREDLQSLRAFEDELRKAMAERKGAA